MFLREIKAGIHTDAKGKAINDGRQFFNYLADFALSFVHQYRRLSDHGIYPVLICKEARYAEYLTGAMLHQPDFAGNKIKNTIDHLFSEIYHVELWTDPNTQQVHRTLRTQRTNTVSAGSRFGRLGEIEMFNLSNIFAKMSA